MIRQLLSLFVLLAIAAILVSAAAADERPPNFIILFTDDQGYQDLGCYGSPDIATPNLDRMAAEGMKFTSFYAQTICGPSRTALMTASYPLRVAQDRNRCETHPVVHSKEITIAEVLRPRGYRSAAFGKWDLATHSQSNWIPELLPRGQGFDYFFGTPSSNDRVVHLLRNEEVIEENADMATLTRRYTDEALRFIEENRDGPFFVYLAHTMPHTILAASEGFKGKSKGGLYGDVIEEIDHHAGRILDKISELGIDDETYVIFTSDNGPWLLRKEHGGHALPLRSGKTTCWEGGVRVPCIVRAPGRVPAGATNDLVAATIDLMPTLATLAGAELPKDRVLDGRDLSRIWHGEQDELDRPFFYYQHFYLRGVRKGDWKVMLRHEEGPGSVTAKWKSHVDPEDAKPLTAHQLFNLEEDIGETTDLSAEHPDKLAELLELAEWARNDIGDFDRVGENARFFDDAPHRLGNPGPRAKPKEKRKPGAAAAGDPKPHSERRVAETGLPNVIFLLTDDLGYSDLGCYGAVKAKTPHIDRLAAEGVRFTDFHTAASICSPSRAAFLTGAYPQRAGLYMGLNPNRTAHWYLGLHPDEITLAEQFRTRGYTTHMVGKWHLGTEPEFLPREHGFDTYYGMPCNFSHSPKFFDGDEEIFARTPLARLTELYTERVTRIIREADGKPFFLYYAHNYPHTPFAAGERFKGTSKDGVRGDVIQELDWGVGKMMKELEAAGVAENTIVIFTSDNGPTSNQYATPFRGTKYVTFEGGHRVPFLFHWPALIAESQVSGAKVHAMDLFPTLSEIIGAPLPEDRVYDGESLLPLFSGKALKRKAAAPFYYYNGENLQAVRMGDWKLHLPRRDEQLPFWDKNRVFIGIENPVLYDLSSDRAESKDVARENPEVVSRLLGAAASAREELGEFMQRGKAQRPTGSIFPEVPVISHERDWGTVDPAIARTIADERSARHPDWVRPVQNRKKPK